MITERDIQSPNHPADSSMSFDTCFNLKCFKPVETHTHNKGRLLCQPLTIKANKKQKNFEGILWD